MILKGLSWFLLIVPLKAIRDKRRIRFQLCGVQFVSAVWWTSCTEIDSAVECTPWRLILRLDAHCLDCLHAVMHTAKIVSGEWCIPQSFWDVVLLTPEKFGTIDSALWCTPRRSSPWWDAQSPRSDAHRGDCLHGVMHTRWSFLNVLNISAKLKNNSKIL